jgi:hypothetical protein
MTANGRRFKRYTKTSKETFIRQPITHHFIKYITFILTAFRWVLSTAFRPLLNCSNKLGHQELVPPSIDLQTRLSAEEEGPPAAAGRSLRTPEAAVRTERRPGPYHIPAETLRSIPAAEAVGIRSLLAVGNRRHIHRPHIRLHHSHLAAGILSRQEKERTQRERERERVSADKSNTKASKAANKRPTHGWHHRRRGGSGPSQ